MGVPKCFGHLGCLEVTLILKDFKTVTGRIVGGLDEDRKKYDGYPKKDDYGKQDDYGCDHKKEDPHDCHDKHEDKCCKPPKIEVEVDIDDNNDFVLIELTRDASSVSLGSVTLVGTTLTVDFTSVVFPAGSCIAVNVADIIYAGVNATITDSTFVLGI